MHKIKLWLIGLLVLICVTIFVLYGWLQTSLPQTNGTIEVRGLSASVSISRDNNGVPHIRGKTIEDIMMGLGYAHAQDRLWQMEVNRRLGAGRMSELFGAATLPIDKLFRTFGFKVKAEKAYNALPENGKTLLKAYAEGVNAYLANRRGALPIEFITSGITPEPWHPVHTMTWFKMMSYDLGGNMRHELARADLMSQISPKQVAELYPVYPGDAAEAPLPDFSDLLADLPIKELAALSPTNPAGYGSNNWVISGDRTTSGMPILANDPHLRLNTPSIWYLVHLQLVNEDGSTKNVVGTSFAGAPMVILGRNDRVAWGFTNTAPDVQDLFIEKVLDNEGKSYLTPDGPADFVIREEIIKIKDAPDLFLNIRESRHGPVISDIYKQLNSVTGKDHVLALQWTALADTDTTIMLSTYLFDAQNIEDFKEAAKSYVSPQQNIVIADVDGNIGLYAPAVIPIRHKDNKIMGRIPSPGWDALYDWQDTIPYDQLPYRKNPDEHMVVTANQKIVGQDYPYYITRDWSLPYRAGRIENLITKTEKHDLTSMAAIQFDIGSDMAADLKPMMLENTNDIAPEIKAALSSWDDQMTLDGPAPMIFATWWRHLAREIYSDELGAKFDRYNRQRPTFIKNVLGDIGGQSRWCDDINTDVIENCFDSVSKALETSIDELTTLYGPDWTKWRWGDAHILRQKHTPFSQVPVLKNIFDIYAPHTGATYTINVSGNSWNKNTPHASSMGPSYRGLFDLSDLEKSLYLMPTGQSGNILSSHYADQFPRWQKGDYFTIPTKFNPASDDMDTLTLSPTITN